jgi:hypothetical protein
LLALFLFNTIGYRYVLNYFEKQTSTELNKSIDKKTYFSDDLVEIKIPLNNPYISDHDYRDAYGETTLKGKFYQYVKRKISENMLYLLCLPNEDKASLIKTKNSLGGSHAQSSSNKQNEKNPIQNILKASQIEYIQTNQFSFDDMYALNSKQSFLFNNSNCTSQFDPNTSAQPPENKI